MKNGSGNATTTNLQEAQVYGWSKRAQENVQHFRDRPDEYVVVDILLTLPDDAPFDLWAANAPLQR